MNIEDLSLYPAHELAKFALQFSPQQLEKAISQIPLDQIPLLIRRFNTADDPEWSKKIRAVIFGLQSKESLEVVGKSLSLSQALLICIKGSEWEQNHHWKLFPLFLGMPHDVFVQLILQATTTQLQLLKQENLSEPIFHHLTLLHHGIAGQLLECEETVYNLGSSIESLELEKMDRFELLSIKDDIEKVSEACQQILEKIEKSLSIVWSIERVDLIEKLCVEKDRCHRLLSLSIGSPHDFVLNQPMSLYAKLEKHCRTVYGDPTNLADIEALQDDDPAIEGMMKFSILYPQDYFEIGLLPNIENLNQVSDQEVMGYQHHLYREAQYVLEQIRLSTVKDLKEASIFSKKMLVEYIQTHLINARS